MMHIFSNNIVEESTIIIKGASRSFIQHCRYFSENNLFPSPFLPLYLCFLYIIKDYNQVAKL
jgi:hypothetical protein